MRLGFVCLKSAVNLTGRGARKGFQDNLGEGRSFAFAQGDDDTRSCLFEECRHFDRAKREEKSPCVAIDDNLANRS